VDQYENNLNERYITVGIDLKVVSREFVKSYDKNSRLLLAIVEIILMLRKIKFESSRKVR
jgi:hypothetical protein